MTKTDQDLLGEFARDQSQHAFTTLVQRHIGLVYCAALRQVRSPQLAEEVAQSVFADLARNTARLKPDTVLTAWLYAVTRRTAINVVRGEARRQLREQIALEMNAMNATPDDWRQVEPLLDEAMHALDDLDRTAILLRFFENKSLREVGERLGTTDDTARKRVNRAVERLREFFAKHDVHVGTSGLMVLISANAIVSAPAGLATALATSAITAGGGATAGFGAQLTAWMGKVSLPTVGAGVLVLGLAGLLVMREVRSARTSLADPNSVGSFETAAASPAQDTVTSTPQLASGTALPAVPPDTTQRDLALKLYREGEEFQRNKKLDEARARYDMTAAIIESGLPSERWMVDFYFTRATMDRPASAKRDHAAAIDDYTKALRIHPNYSSALANRALAFSTLKQYEAANADFTRLIEDASVDYSRYLPGRTNGMAWAYEYRGRMWLDARRSAEAIPDLQNAVALYEGIEEKVHAQFYLGVSYKAAQQPEQLLAEANSMAEQALKWATRPGGTDKERSAAESGARWANEFLDYKGTYQLEVSAAVNAKLGDFRDAVKLQERALRELPASAEDQRAAMQTRLEWYRARKALIAP
jgi:RNA polymerase sigma factor (sigma-70 family)